MSIAITIAYGDGPGPGLMEETLLALRESGADVTIETIEIGARIYAMDHPLGILPSAFDTLKRNKILLKAPTLMPAMPGYMDVSQVIRDVFKLDASHRRLDAPDAPLAHAYINEEMALFEPLEGMQATPAHMLAAAQMLLAYVGFTGITLKACGMPALNAL